MSLSTALQDYQQALGPRVLGCVRAANGRAPSLDARLAAAGVQVAPGSGQVPPGSGQVSDLDAVAVLKKDDLPALQRAEPPFGGLYPDGATLTRIFASPGPIYEAQLGGEDPWGWAPAMAACGIGADDIVLNCFSYHLSPAGAMFDEACRAIGASVVPAGVGATEIQAQLVADLGVTAYIGLPSYLGALMDRYHDLGLDPSAWQVSKALVTAEPLPDQLRERLMRRVPTVLMAYGTAEAGLIGYEESAGTGLRIPSRVYVQICDPDDGRPVTDDQPGEVVVTVLHEDYPLLRFGTGDVSRWQLDDEGGLRLAGVLGRVGTAVKVRGMFVHPHQARSVISALAPAGVSAGRFVVGSQSEKDVLLLELVAGPEADRERIVELATSQTKEQLRVRPEVSLVPSIEDGNVLVDARKH